MSNLLSDSLGDPEEQSEQSQEAAAAATGRAEDEPQKRINFNVPKSLREQLKERCESEGRTLTYVLTRFAKHYAEGGDLP